MPGQHHFYATCHPGLEAVVAAELAGPTIRATAVHAGTAGHETAAATMCSYHKQSCNCQRVPATAALGHLSRHLQGMRSAGAISCQPFRCMLKLQARRV